MFERWQTAQLRVHHRWYLATQAFAVSWPVAGGLSYALDWSSWTWLALVPPWLVCRRAWREAYRRLMDGSDHYVDWLKAEHGRFMREAGE